MSTEANQLLVALDANVFLAVLLPETTKAGHDNVAGAERLLRALAPGRLIAVTTAMTLAEIRWVFARSGRGDHTQAHHTLVTGMADRLEIAPVTASLADACGELRSRYYSRSNDMSYVDALCLATALDSGACALISSDPHLLKCTAGLPVVEPKAVPAGDVAAWLRELPKTA